MHRKLTPAVRASALTAASQVLTAGFYLGVVAWTPQRVSDLYFFTSAWTTAAPLVIATGLMYPLWLRGLATAPRWWRRAGVASVLLCLLGAGVSTALTRTARGLNSSETSLIGVVTAVSVLMATLLLLAWSLASYGHAVWPGLVSGPPAAVAFATLFLLRGSESALHWAIIAQGVAILVLILGAFHAVRRLGGGVELSPKPGTVLRLLGRAGSGFGLGLVTQAAALTLPVGALSTYNLLSRGTTAVVSVAVNAGLPALVHRHREPSSKYWSLMNWLVLGSLVLAGLTASVGRVFADPILTISMTLCAIWVGCSALNAMTQLVALHSGDEKAVLRVFVVAVAGITVVGLLYTASALSLPILLASVAGTEVVGAVASSLRTGRVSRTAALAMTLALSLGVVMVWAKADGAL